MVRRSVPWGVSVGVLAASTLLLPLATGHTAPAPHAGSQATTGELYALGTQRAEAGDYRGAIEAYTAALRLNPTDGVAYNDRGLAHYRLGEHQAALADLE